MYKPNSYKIPKTSVTYQEFNFPDGMTGGMNTRYAQDKIADNESPEMLNMCFDAGFPVKRPGINGWGSYGVDPIHGMVFYHNPETWEWVLLVAYQERIYQVDLWTGVLTDVMYADLLDNSADIVRFFMFGNYLYFIGDGMFGRYDWDAWLASGIPATPIGAYVPTITLGRSPDGTTSTVYEGVNRLNAYVTDSFSGTAGDTVYYLSRTAIDTVSSVYVNGVLMTVGVDYTVSLVNGTITFMVAPGVGTNNVLVTYGDSDIPGYDPASLNECTGYSVYGGDNDSRIFLFGNPDYPNRIFYSDITEDGPDGTYFPFENFIEIGDEIEYITGMIRFMDYQIIYKENEQYYQTIDDTVTPTEFPVLPLNNEYGCISARTVVEIDNGILALSRHGVTWTKATQVRSQMAVDLISEKVNQSSDTIMGILENSEADMMNAHAIKWDNKYILHIGSYVWVLDLVYSDLENGVYCWYPWSGSFSSANCFDVSGTGDLYMGGSASGILSWTDKALFSDRGSAINSYWTTKRYSADSAHWVKKFDNLFLTFQALTDGHNTLTWMTPSGEETVTIVLSDTTAFDFSSIDFSEFFFAGAFFPFNTREKAGYREEFLQWKIGNNTVNECLGISEQAIQYIFKKEVR